MNLLRNKKYLCNKFDIIHIWSPTIVKDPSWSQIELPASQKHLHYDEILFQKLLDDAYQKNLRQLMIFSDCGAEAIKKGGNQKNPLDGAQMNARWDNTSFIFDAQSICNLSIATRQNCDGAIIFEALNDREISNLYDEFGKGRKKLFLEVLELATTPDYSFLFVHRQGPKQTYWIKFHSIINYE